MPHNVFAPNPTGAVGGGEGPATGLEGRSARFQNVNTNSLPGVTPGQRGNLKAIALDETGDEVQFTLNGTTPGAGVGSQRGVVTRASGLAMDLRNIDLSQVRVRGEASNDAYTVFYEVYL